MSTIQIGNGKYGASTLDRVSIGGQPASLETLQIKILTQATSLQDLVDGEGGETLSKASVAAISTQLTKWVGIFARGVELPE